MKYLKKYESLDEPEVGDYVIINGNEYKDPEIKNWCRNNIGKIIDINRNAPNRYYNIFRIFITYENFPTEFIKKIYPVWCDKENILHFSKDKDKLELILKAQQYNL